MYEKENANTFLLETKYKIYIFPVLSRQFLQGIEPMLLAVVICIIQI